jgi:hypothetical protein
MHGYLVKISVGKKIELAEVSAHCPLYLIHLPEGNYSK